MIRTARLTLSIVLGALILSAVPALAGCSHIGAGGVPPTVENGPPTTTNTPPTAPATAEQQKLEQARDIVQTQLTGIKLFITTPSVERCTNESRLIVHGTVTGADAPHPAAGDVTNPYIVFYVEPDEVLKGSPSFGTPVAFALLAPVGGAAESSVESPLSTGDEVLLFSYHADENLPTGSGTDGAYFPWNDSYGIFLAVGDQFVNVLAPFAFTTLEQVRTTVGPKGTSTTLGPGVISFEGKASRFEDRVQGKRLPGTLPYEVMAGEELDWLPQAAAPLTMTVAKGYRFANGDVVLLWDIIEAGTVQETEAATPRLLKSLEAGAMEQYGVSADQVWVFWYGGFGYVVASRDYRQALGSLAQMAETGAPLN
jgi:hypothetical protein